MGALLSINASAIGDASPIRLSAAAIGKADTRRRPLLSAEPIRTVMTDVMVGQKECTLADDGHAGESRHQAKSKTHTVIKTMCVCLNQGP